jgi:stage III sporulation protein AA
MEEVYQTLPEHIITMMRNSSPSLIKELEEIRIRLNRPLELIVNGVPYYPSMTSPYYIVSKEDCTYFINKVSQHSIYTLEEELKRGYITIEGGHRVGLAGKVITENSKVKAIRDLASFNIRIARQKIGAANALIPYLYKENWLSTVIIGPPGTGKTTILRDIARLISKGNANKKIPSKKVGIVDERSEIAGCIRGVPQHDLGHRVDVLDSCPKAEGMMMLIRSMSPDVLIVDEIGRKEDTEAIIEAVNAGVKLMVTVHGFSFEDLLKRPSIRPLIDACTFDRYIELSRRDGPGTIKRIRDEKGRNINVKVSVNG